MESIPLGGGYIPSYPGTYPGMEHPRSACRRLTRGSGAGMGPTWPLQDIRLRRGCRARINHPFHPPGPPALPILVQYYCTIIGQYKTPFPTSCLYAIYHTILVIPISCKGQGPTFAALLKRLRFLRVNPRYLCTFMFSVVVVKFIFSDLIHFVQLLRGRVDPLNRYTYTQASKD